MFILLSSVRMEQLGSHFADFHEILYVRVFRKSVEKILFLLKSDKNNGYFTWRPVYVYENVSLSSYKMKNISGGRCRENKNTSFVQ
jgi:hypothetical protein